MPNSVVNLVKSFHDGMKAQLSINGELLVEKIGLDNGLRQGCTMAPTLFNLNACLMMERWTAQVRDLEGTGTCLLYTSMYDGKLFRRSTRGASHTQMNECQFANDTALLATNRHAAEVATLAYVNVARDFGLTVSLTKTKMMVTGYGVGDADREPIVVGESEIGCVDEFPYLGSMVWRKGGCRSRPLHRQCQQGLWDPAPCCVHRPQLNTTTKRKVYQACVLPVLLYGCECWTPKCRYLNRLNAFHHQCIHTILGITSPQQWEQHIISACMRDLWGDQETMDTKIAKRRLEWLGHVARMPDHRMPKMSLFGWLPQTRPLGGPWKKWRDVIRRDLQAICIPEEEWYKTTLSRERWSVTYISMTTK